jgi:uncharacterized protein
MKTALITGASEGIGYELAKIFAKNGHDLILIERNENRLQEVTKELSANNIQVKYYAKDLSVLENAKFIYEDLKSQNIKVEYVVNNAGFGINGEYADIEWQRELEMFNLNMITLAYFTKVFAKDMKERGFGRIMNLGSTGSFQPGPYMAGYCATKAFVLHLSEAINYELKKTNVSVTTLCPGVTDSKFHSVANTGKTLMSKFLSHASPENVAKYGSKIMMKGKSYGIHGLMNKLMIFSIRFTGRRIVTALSAKLLRNKDIQQK